MSDVVQLQIVSEDATVPKTDLPEEEDEIEHKENGETPAKAEESMETDTSVNADMSANDTVNKSDEGNVGDNEEEEEESDDEEELPPGLLERPIEILEEKRVRKKITRFNYDDAQTSPSSEKKKNTFVIPKGTGTKLREHPRVEFQLQKNKGEDLKIIHKFFYGAIGDQHSCKRHLREFSGFTFEKDSQEYEKKEEIIGRFTVDNLKWAMDVCDIPHVKGNKDDLIDAFMAWSMCPQPQDKPLPGKKKKKEPTKKKVTVKRKIKTDKQDDQSTDAGTPAKKQSKKKDGDAKKKKAKTSPSKKISTPQSNKKAKIKIASKNKPITDTDSDDEPLLQKKKGPPTNEEISDYVEKLLQGADLEVITMKSVFQQVYEQYPDFDLSDRKSFIKETVKKIIS